MLDGRYKVEMVTPMGRKQGDVVLRTEGGQLFTRIDAPIIGKQEFVCSADGDSFSGEGSFKVMLLGTVTFKGRGYVEGDDLHAILETNSGTFQIEGKRV